MRNLHGEKESTQTCTVAVYALIKRCNTIKQLHQLHAHSITSGLLSRSSISHFINSILYVFTTLLSSDLANTCLSSPTTRQSLSSYAHFVFNSIPIGRQCHGLSAFSYNNIIRAHCLLSSPFSALLLFSHMRRRSVLPDFHTYPFALKACSKLRSSSLVCTLHSQALKFGFLPDLFVQNALIHCYFTLGCTNYAVRLFTQSSNRDIVSYNSLLHGLIKAGDIAGARQVFDQMPVRDLVSWGTILSGYVHANKCREVIQLLRRMFSLHLKPDNVALVAALSACAQLGELEQGKIIHDYIKCNRILLDAFLSTALVNFYAKCGCIDIARDIFESSAEKNLCTWNAMLVGLALHGQGRVVIDYFYRMIYSGVQPDGVSFLGVLLGCCHAGLVHEARKLFDNMEPTFGVPRELKHYGCMSDLLGRAGLIREAEEMIKRMPVEGDVFVWGGLLGGCRIYGNVNMAETVAKQVMLLKPEDVGVYSIMADIYANTERWEDVGKVRRSISSRKMVRKKACSALV